jgi:purine nucleosidase
MTRHFLIDTDAGSDDAVALVMALQHPGVQVEAITVVAGNVPVDQGVQNALYTVELCQQAVPVHRGMPVPLTRPLETAQNVHGQDGMGDIGLPLAGRVPASGDAVRVLRRTIHQYAGDLTLVTLGPLTNVAVALRQEPSLASAVRECIIMGGTGQGHGNVTPVAEYNFWADPEAARIVFESGLPIKMVGWDISHTYAVFDPQDAAALRAVDTPLARFCMDIQGTVEQFALGTTRLRGFDLPDPIAMAVALDPAVATRTERCHVEIEAASPLCRGQSVVDRLGLMGQVPNAEVVIEASRERFLQILYDAVDRR